MESPDVPQRRGNPGEFLVDGRDLVPDRVDLWANRGIERADRRAAGRTLHQCQLAAVADGREQGEFKAVSAALAAGRNGHLLLLAP